MYEHAKYKFPVLYVPTNDSHSFFSVNFKTIPTDDLYALRHLITFSSENYQIKNLFYHLKNISFATKLESEFHDTYTTYYFSTTNKNDFFNIFPIFFDAIFHPLINTNTVSSECFRLEYDPTQSEPLQFNGTIYNELKNYISQPETIFTEALHKDLFSYKTEHSISNVTVNKLKEIHQQYYRPENMYIFYYGTIPAKTILNKLTSVISNVSFNHSKPLNIEELKIKKLNRSKTDAIYVPAKNGLVRSLSWVTGDLHNTSDYFDFNFLLLHLSNFYPHHNRTIKLRHFGTQIFLTITTNEEIHIGITQYLNNLITKGFDNILIFQLLNQYEINLMINDEIQGYKIWKRIINGWVNDIDPFKLIDPIWEIERLRQMITIYPHYLQELLQQRIINNPIKLELILIENENQINYQQENEKKLITYIKDSLSKNDIRNIQMLSNIIEKYSTSKDDLNLINENQIKITDFKDPPRNINIKTINNDNDDIKIIPIDNKEMFSLEIKCKLPLDSIYIEYVPLLKGLFESVNENNFISEILTSQEISLTSGIICNLHTQQDDINNTVNGYFTIRSSAQLKNAILLFSIFEKMFLKENFFDNEQILKSIKELNFNLNKDSDNNKVEFNSRLASSDFTNSTILNEIWNGYSSINKIKKLLDNNDDETILEIFKKTYKKVFLRSNFSLSIHCHQSLSKVLNEYGTNLINKLNNYKIGNSEKYNKNFWNEIKNNLVTNSKENNYSTLAILLNTKSINLLLATNLVTNILNDYYIIPLLKSNNLNVNLSTNVYIEEKIVTFTIRNTNEPKMIFQMINESIDKIINDKVDDEIIKFEIINLMREIDKPMKEFDYGRKEFIFNLNYDEEIKRRKIILNLKKENVTKGAILLKNGKRKYIINGKKVSNV